MIDKNPLLLLKFHLSKNGIKIKKGDAISLELNSKDIARMVQFLIDNDIFPKMELK